MVAIKFCTCKKTTIVQKDNNEKESSSPKFSISFQVMKFISNVLKTFVSTLCYNKYDDCDF
jgi:hypothetical protein